MQAEEICKKLIINHNVFLSYTNNLSAIDYEYAPTNKWNAGQQVKHILQSTTPILKALKLPKFILLLLFGNANRPSKPYEAILIKYQDKLQQGGVASARFTPQKISFTQKENLCASLKKNISKLAKVVANHSETDLDKYILPHPLLGKLTLREMLYFTVFHVEHHQKLIAKYLNEK